MGEQDLEEALNNLSTGSAICFLGAGFAAEATDANGKVVPNTDELTEEICGLVGVSRAEGGSLADLADFCDHDGDLQTKLKLLLVQRLTLCKPSENQVKILAAPWRSIFTTNFDDVAERGTFARNPQIVTPTTDTKAIVGDKLPIYYMHGRARDILENNGDPRLVLSETNYLELRSRNTNLHATFLNELHCANRIFFIGYSLRDAEIASRLFEISEALSSKSIVICGPTEGKIAQARLRKFGSVFPIGLAGPATQMPKPVTFSTTADKVANLAFVSRVPSQPAASAVQREDIDRLIITGEFDYSKFAAQKTETNSADQYCVERTDRISAIFDSVSGNFNRFVITSDIGNGKTIFLNQLIYAGHARGYDVFKVDSRLTEVFKDLELLLARKTRQIFLVDDVIRNRETARFIGARLSGLSLLVCSSREALDETRFGALSEVLGSASKEIDLNILSDSELERWDQLLERWGYWEQKISWTAEKRLDFLKNDCGAENRSIILSIFRSSRVAEKIHLIVSYFLQSSPEHTKAFVAILICSLCQKHVDWGHVVQWLGIDDQALRKDMQRQSVFDFMSGRRDWYRLTSTQLAAHIFQNFEFDENLLVDTYVKIVRETAYSANDRRSGFDSVENLKELMKYRFLTRIFGEGGGALSSIESIYRRLSGIPRIRDNDQFWLQYAMSSLEVENIDDAEAYINTALGIAKRRGQDYSNHQILDQRVRLLLLKNAKRIGAVNLDELTTAITDLEMLQTRGATEKIYPLRSAEYIFRLLEAKIDVIDIETRKHLLRILLAMQTIISTQNLEKAQRGEKEKLARTIARSVLILKNA